MPIVILFFLFVCFSSRENNNASVVFHLPFPLVFCTEVELQVKEGGDDDRSMSEMFENSHGSLESAMASEV